MRVVLNAYTTIGNKTGIGRYTEELLRCLRDRLSSEELFAYPHSWVRKLRSKWKSNTVSERAPTEASTVQKRAWPSPRRTAVSLLRPIGHGVLWAYDKSVMRKGKFDLYHEPNYIPIACDLPTVVTVHDLSIVRHPEWHPAERVAFFEKHFERGLRQACHFFTDTEHARREMVDLLQIPASKITCTYCGTRPDLRPMTEEEYRPVLDRLGLPEKYLLHVGTIEPRKNLLRLMRAYVDLPAPLRERYPLVLVGQWGWKFDETADYFHAMAKHKGVIQTGFLPDADLPAVYNGARALVFPTLYEGFGIPPVEMMGCGGAVLASTAGAVAEVVGSHASLIRPENVEGWRDAMRRVLTDDEWWQGLRQGVVQRANRFTWDRTAEETLRIYRQMTGEGIRATLAA